MDSSASDSRTVEKKLHATVISLNLAKKKKKKKEEENDYHSCEHFVTYMLYNFFSSVNIQMKVS